MIAFTILLTSIAAVTGLLAIGNGRHWKFTIGDYFRGKRNSILYLWVTASSIFSICHSGVLVEYGYHHNWVVPDGSMRWMVLHATMGVLLTAAHIFVASTLSKEVGPVDKFLWGKNKYRAAE